MTDRLEAAAVRVVARIVCTITGEAVDYIYEAGREGQVFWWTDGNAGCDCNRRLFFLRAKMPELSGLLGDEKEAEVLAARAAVEGRVFDPEDDSPCGVTMFTVPWIEIDGKRVEIQR